MIVNRSRPACLRTGVSLPLTVLALCLCTNVAAAATEIPEEDETFAFFSQYLTRFDTAVIERQYKVQIGTLADTAGSAYDIKTRMSAVNQKRRDPFARTAIGFIDSSHCKNNGEIRQNVTADEMF